MTKNTTGIPMNVTKDPQCRHSERQDFVSYSVTASMVTASCSNCGSVGDTTLINWRIADPLRNAKEAARNLLMKKEAPPLAP